METDLEYLEWADVQSVGRQIFTLWASGSDLRWAEHVWSALAEESLTSYSTEVERSVCVLRLVTLDALSGEFRSRADKARPANGGTRLRVIWWATTRCLTRSAWDSSQNNGEYTPITRRMCPRTYWARSCRRSAWRRTCMSSMRTGRCGANLRSSPTCTHRQVRLTTHLG